MRLPFLLISFLLFASGCRKDIPDTLPPITQIGANTFGCKINGQVWVPYFPCSEDPSGCSELAFTVTQLYPPDTLNPLSFGLEGGNVENGHTYLGISCLGDSDYNITGKTGTISQTGNHWDSLSVTYICDSGFYFSSGYRTGYHTPGDNVTITKFDPVKRIISGTFSCTLYGGNSPIVITDGRFDFKIAPLCKCSP